MNNPPSQSPAPRKFLSAYWRNLLMLNYQVDPSILMPYVPAGTELDFYEGAAYVSFVGFLFENCKVLGLAIPYHRDFEEVNLRFYVKYAHEGELRRGVVFIKEIVPRTAIAFVARHLYRENYIALPMAHSLTQDTNSPSPHTLEYSWKFKGNWNRLAASNIGNAREVESDSLEDFITEHYWGYTRVSDSKTSEYKVEHPKWKVCDVASASLECDVATLYGSAFCPFTKEPPASTFLAVGSEISVYVHHKIDFSSNNA